jgi:hypothetical protein
VATQAALPRNPHFPNPDPDPDPDLNWEIPQHWRAQKERLKLCQYLLANKVLLRTIFLRLTTVVINPEDLTLTLTLTLTLINPKDIFSFSAGMLKKLVKDVGMEKRLNDEARHEMFQAAKVPIVRNQRKNSKGALIEGKVPGRVQRQSHLDMAEWLDCCCDLATRMYPRADPETGAPRSMTARFQLLLEEHLQPLIKDYELGPFTLEDADGELTVAEMKLSPAVKEVMAEFKNRVKKVFLIAADGRRQAGEPKVTATLARAWVTCCGTLDLAWSTAARS